MNHQIAIIAMLAILSIAALVGVFTIQVADAQLPRLGVDATGVVLRTEEVGLIADTIGVGVSTEEFLLSADPLGEVDLATEEFALSADGRGVSIIPNLSEE